MTQDKTKNPYETDTPEWQLYSNMVGCNQQANAFHADADKYLKLAHAAREKALKFEEALIKLNASNAQ